MTQTLLGNVGGAKMPGSVEIGTKYPYNLEFLPGVFKWSFGVRIAWTPPQVCEPVLFIDPLLGYPRSLRSICHRDRRG